MAISTPLHSATTVSAKGRLRFCPGLHLRNSSSGVILMMRRNWLHLDDLRESWLFLILSLEEPNETERGAPIDSHGNIEYWEIGTGNAESLVRTNAARIGVDGVKSEEELLERLLDALQPYRYQPNLLITPDRATLTTLRGHLMQSVLERRSLRGFAHVALADLLKRYFGQELHDYRIDQESLPSPRVTDAATESFVSNGGAERLWSVWMATYGLLPVHELEGIQL